MMIRNIHILFEHNATIGYLSDTAIIYNNCHIDFPSNEFNSFLWKVNNNTFIRKNTNQLYILESTCKLNYLYEIDPGHNILPFSNEIIIDYNSMGLRSEFTFINLVNNSRFKLYIENCLRSIQFYPFLILIDINTEIVTLYSYNSNTILWTFSAKELGAYDDYEGHHEGKIACPIIECNGVLVTGLSTHMVGDGIAKRIGIDVESGIVLWLKAYPALDVPEFRNYKGELLAFGKMFSKVNPHTGEVIEDYFPFKELTGYYHKLLITDEYLFTSTLKTELKQISRKSGKVIWTHTLYADKEAGRRGKKVNGNDPLQYAGGKLYVLDSEKTLHILDVGRD
jgi:hypothetical protein